MDHHSTEVPGPLDRIVNDSQPFGPIDTESLVDANCADAEQLFDRSNLIYAQATGRIRPTYIIGRKGAGKTAFLLGGNGRRLELLRTANIYSELMATLRCYNEHRGPLFVDQVSDIWRALFDQVAIAYGCRTATSDDGPQLQVMWDYMDQRGDATPDALTVAERFLADLQRRIKDPSVVGLREVIDSMTCGGVAFAQAREAAHVVLTARREPVTLVMDNLEDLHSRLDDVREGLAGLFMCVGRVMEGSPRQRPFGLHICLPSELFATIQDISSNPEKDFQASSYLTIYWTAPELLHLAGSRLRLFLARRHPDALADLLRRVPQARPDARDPEPALLRATLPSRVSGDLGIEEDPVAYLLRHTQLLPRHLLQILNRVYGPQQRDSVPWAVTPSAVVRGTHGAEEVLVRGILAAYQQSYPLAGKVLGRMSDRLGLAFTASDLHKLFNRQGIRKLTGMDFGEFLEMLLRLGVVGVRVRQTARYNEAEFQYTFDSTLNAEEDSSVLCVHPLFSRFLAERSFPRLRREGALPTYPYGCDPSAADYRGSLGYALAAGG
jgi:hypothetical protein